MNRIEKAFAQEKNLLNIFVTAGYPRIDSLISVVKELINQGVDILEIGLPYSDPLADGEVIQNTSAIALENGITLTEIFKQVEIIRKSTPLTPIILMGYFNQMLQVGVEQFLKNCKDVGVDGLIIPDLPVEVYQENYEALFNNYGINISFLITPQTTNERIAKLDAACTSFLYIVADNSLTGSSLVGFTKAQLAYFKRINDLKLASPTMIGFGISTKQMVEEANKYANGAIIGSAFLESLKNGSQVAFINKLI